MDKIFKKIIAIAFGFVCSVVSIGSCAVDISTEFYKSEDLPECYEKRMVGDYYTIITISNWEYSSIDFFESRLSNGGEERRQNFFEGVTSNIDSKSVICSCGYLPGEPVKYSLKSPDGKTRESITLIPYPIFAQSKRDGAKIEAKIVGYKTSTYTIAFSGFQAEEDLLIESVSHHEKTKFPLKVNESVVIGYNPEVINKFGGLARFKVVRASGEILAIEIPWKLELLRYVYAPDENGKITSADKCQSFLKSNPQAAKYFKTKKSGL
jgi:hypothetical protein